MNSMKPTKHGLTNIYMVYLNEICPKDKVTLNAPNNNNKWDWYEKKNLQWTQI